jgi:hypothetical protein
MLLRKSAIVLVRTAVFLPKNLLCAHSILTRGLATDANKDIKKVVAADPPLLHDM